MGARVLLALLFLCLTASGLAGAEDVRPVAKVQLRLLGSVQNAQAAVPIARQGWRVVCVAGESLIWPMAEDWGKIGSVEVTPLRNGKADFAQFAEDLFLYCSRSHLYCVDLTKGAIRWSRALSEKELEYPIAANSEKILVFANRKIQALSIRDGAEDWSVNTNSRGMWATRADFAGNDVYLSWCREARSLLDWISGRRGDVQVNVCCLSLSDGKGKWSVSWEPENELFWAMPVVTEGRLFFVLRSGHVDELSIAGGSVVNGLSTNDCILGDILCKGADSFCTFRLKYGEDGVLCDDMIFKYDINRKEGTFGFVFQRGMACVLDSSIVFFGPHVAIRDAPQGLKRYSVILSNPLPEGSQVPLRNSEARGIAAFWQADKTAGGSTAVYEVLVDYDK
ncbi:MAG: PQQ-binding-like beta-propeller repeat protein [Candidatus Brocadiia bacterium]